MFYCLHTDNTRKMSPKPGARAYVVPISFSLFICFCLFRSLVVVMAPKALTSVTLMARKTNQNETKTITRCYRILHYNSAEGRYRKALTSLFSIFFKQPLLTDPFFRQSMLHGTQCDGAGDETLFR